MDRTPRARARTLAKPHPSACLGAVNRSPAANVTPSSVARFAVNRRHIPWLTFTLGTALSVAVFGLIRASERVSLQTEFERRAQNVSLRVEDYLLRNVEPLYALRNLFDYSDSVTREEFAGVARDLISRSVSVQALEWVPRVPNTERARVEAETRAEGFPGFQFTERATPTTLRRAADRPEHFPVLYVEPFAANKLALGFDLTSGISWQVMQSIAATGQLGASGRLPLLDNENTGNTWAYIIQLPVYDRPLNGATPAERQAVLRGFILGVFRLRDLLETMFHRMGGLGIDVLFIDNTVPADPKFLHHHAEAPAPAATPPPTVAQIAAGMHHTLKLNHAGRHWELWAQPSQVWLARQPVSRGWFALALGVMFSGGLSLFLRSQQRRTVIVEDLVARRTAELATAQQALAGSEERYRAFIGQSAEPIWRCENAIPVALDTPVEAQIEHLFTHAYLAECNDAMARAYGYTTAAQLVGTPLAAMLKPDDRKSREFLRAFLTAPGHQLIDVETEELDRNGQTKIFLNSLVGIVEDGRLVRAWGTQRDITARRHAELALAESRRLLDSMMDQLPGMSVRCTAGPGYPAIYISRGVELLTGYVAEDFFSNRIRYGDLIHPDDLPGVWPAILAGTDSHQPFQIQYRIRDRAGREHWVLEVGHGLYHTDGHLEFIDSLSIDCTAQKQAEAAKLALERQLADGQRLESLGVLAGGIAHDFNNLLTAILGHASLARLQAPPGANIESLQQIELASRRAADLCQQMLAYAGKGKITTAPVDLGELIRGTVSLLEVSIGKNIRLALRLDPVLPSVLGDATQLRQIVMNLVLNAADAIGPAPGGCIEISGTTESVDAARFAAAVGAPALPSGDYAVLEIQDNGCGMAPAILARIFEPFYTTKFTGRGLGLSAVLGIVQGHRGALFVASTAGEGTCFRLLLPAIAPATPAAPVVDAGAAQPNFAGRSILIIDDEPSVRQIATSILKRAGASVHTAASGDDALVWVRDARPSLDLVLLDLTMPGLSGEETLSLLHTLLPELPVILMSGYSESGILNRLGQQGAVDFLQKPFELDALLGRIRSVLDRRA